MKNVMILLLLVGAGFAQDAKKRVYVTDHESWEKASTLVAGTYSGATRSEQIKSLAKACPEITITDDPARADLIVTWDSKTWQQTSWGGHENEFAVYNSSKDMVGSGAAHHIKNAAKDICKLLTK